MSENWFQQANDRLMALDKANQAQATLNQQLTDKLAALEKSDQTQATLNQSQATFNKNVDD